MGTQLLWPVACLVAGLLLLIIEVFVPSGGVIGFLSVGLLIFSLWQAFAISTSVGAIFLLVLVFLLPLTLALAIRIWPKTPLGKWLFLKPPLQEDVKSAISGPRLDHLIGQIGRAITPLRPSGLVDFDGRRLDALAEEGLIPKGAIIRAVHIRGSQLVVRAATLPAIDESVPSMDELTSN